MILDEIREKTKKLHQQLDQQLFPLIQQTNDPREYAHMLAVFYGFYKPMQDKLDIYLNDTVVQDYSSRRKPTAILNDIQLLQIIPEIIYCTDTPDIADTASALGAFYVLEGATMGGSIISRKLMTNTGLPEDRFSFFAGYGPRNHEMWNNFLIALERYTMLHGENKQICDAAFKTFLKFRDWISIQYPKQITHEPAVTNR